MARQYLDTSAQVSLYVPEPATVLVQNVVSFGDDVIVSRWTLVEFRSALWGKVRQGQLLATDALARLALYDADRPSMLITELDGDVLDQAAELIDRYGVSERLLPPDALIVAGALVEHRREPIYQFITTDVGQARVAAAEGLRVGP